MSVSGYDPSVYNSEYYLSHCGAPYDRVYDNGRWLAFFRAIAERMVADYAPCRSLDVGCAKGFLVEALRDLGVQADGFDVSPTAIAEVREDVQPYCRVGSADDDSLYDGHYDVISCIEVLEHLPAEMGAQVIRLMCSHTDVVIFSSTPSTHVEPTHINVQPPEYWSSLFARWGFSRSTRDAWVAVTIAPHAVVYKKKWLIALEDQERRHAAVLQQALLRSTEQARPPVSYAGSALQASSEAAAVSPICVQVYYGDQHSDFREDCSERRSVPEEQSPIDVDEVFVCPSDCSAVRVDPVNRPGILANLRVEVTAGPDRTTRELHPSQFECVELVPVADEWFCLTYDPRIVLRGMSLQRGDEVRVRASVSPLAPAPAARRLRQALDSLGRQAKRRADDLNRELFMLRTEVEGLRSVAELHRSRIRAMQNNVDALTDSLRVAEEESRRLREELLGMAATKGWRLLNLLRALRNAAREPGVTLRKLVASYRQFGVRRTAVKVSEKLRRGVGPAIAAVPYDFWVRDEEANFLARRQQVEEEMAAWDAQPLVSIVMPTYNSEVTWLREAVNSVLAQPYVSWELILSDDNSRDEETRAELRRLRELDPRITVLLNEENRGISGNTNVGLQAARGELITFLDHDDILAPHALYEVVKAYNSRPFDVLYSDEDKLGAGVYEDAFFKPDYSPDYLLSCNYFNHLTVLHRSVLERVGLLRSEYDGAQDYDLLLRATEVAQRVEHVPHVLYHWRKVAGSTAQEFGAKSYAHDAGKRAIEAALQRRGEAGEVVDDGIPGHYRVIRSLVATPLISIIIPIRDKVDLLKTCLGSLKSSTYPNIEIIVVDNGSREPETVRYLESQTHIRVLRFDIPFNYSRLNNWASREARGDYLVFLNNDIEVVTASWLEGMLQHAQRASVGVVGAKLLYPDGRIQHAGVVLGIGGVAGHVYKRRDGMSTGYFDGLLDIRNYSAVTAACMMVRRAVFEEVGGFDDENLPVAFNDVDLCLRILDHGYLCVLDPHVVLYHHESVSRGGNLDYNEIFYMQGRWGERLLADPYYNVHLSLDIEDFQFDGERGRKGFRGFRASEDAIRKAYQELCRARHMEQANPDLAAVLVRLVAARRDLQMLACRSDGSVDMAALLRWAVQAIRAGDSASDLLRPFSADLRRLSA